MQIKNNCKLKKFFYSFTFDGRLMKSLKMTEWKRFWEHKNKLYFVCNVMQDYISGIFMRVILKERLVHSLLARGRYLIGSKFKFAHCFLSQLFDIFVFPVALVLNYYPYFVRHSQWYCWMTRVITSLVLKVKYFREN